MITLSYRQQENRVEQRLRTLILRGLLTTINNDEQWFVKLTAVKFAVFLRSNNDIFHVFFERLKCLLHIPWH